jgi:predicted DNA-binding WGR domain protein
MRVFLQLPSAPGAPPKFYQIVLERDLLGGWTLTRNYGLQGNRGTQKVQHFDQLEAAQAALLECRDAQLQAGFRVMFQQGETAP